LRKRFTSTIAALLAEARKIPDRRAARAAWARQAGAAWLKAHHEMDEFLTAAVERMGKAEFERLCDAEFAKVDAMMAELRAAIDEDKWPKSLYFAGV
jgi:hypothetical protein